jgi:hypothetical protein
MTGEQQFDNMAKMNRIQRERIRRSQPQRQEQLSEFILASSEMAQSLRQTIRLRQMATTVNEISFYNRQASEIERRIYQYFERSFGIDLFEILTQPEPNKTPPRPDTQSHQPNVSYVNTGPSSYRSHTYGNTYGKLDCSQSETRPAVDRSQPASYLETMRRLHPVRLGDVIDGLRVVETFWRSSPEEGDVPCYKLQGDREPRVFTKPIS